MKMIDRINKSRRAAKVLVAAVFCAMIFISHVAADLFEIMQILTLAQISVIFGEDDRLDLYQVKDPHLRKAADSTVALFKTENISIDAENGVANLSTVHYGESHQLCKDERFYDQLIGASCSGVLVGPDIVLTAWHCIKSDRQCDDIRVVFGFAVSNEGEYPETVPMHEVYQCAGVIKGNYDSQRGDWAFIQLDRAVSGHEPLKMSPSGEPINKGTPLVVIGHPSALPVKIAGNAKVLDPMPEEEFFGANLDAYAGNSGSPVFNAHTLLIEGLDTHGDVDYIAKGDCYVSRRAITQKDIYPTRAPSYEPGGKRSGGNTANIARPVLPHVVLKASILFEELELINQERQLKPQAPPKDLPPRYRPYRSGPRP
ncbi:trypsin-like serine peptidase [Elusimicrobiota bacterium]